MSNIYFFDTDCLSTFLRINRQDILIKVFENNKMYIPPFVHQELLKAPEPILSNLTDMINNGYIAKKDIFYGTKEFKEYYLMTKPDPNIKNIGDGEASAIALAKIFDGIVVSNNYKDILYYVNLYNLKYTTTSDILVKSLKMKITTKKECNKIWKDMLAFGNYMPEKSFDDYYSKNNK